jgi:adenosylmethionine-8-amino-7-oxononanoate aminotransferase
MEANVAKIKTANGKAGLILCRTSKGVVEKGIPVMTRGEGCRVFDDKGNSYLDLAAGVTRPVHVGYGRAELAEALKEQALRLGYFTPMHFTNDKALELPRPWRK